MGALMPTSRLLLAALLALGLGGCDVDYADNSLDGALVTPDQVEARPGQVLMLAPGLDALIEVERASRTSRQLPLDENPTQLSRPPGSDVLYTLHPQDGLLNRVGLDGSVTPVELGGPFNRLHWAPDGVQAIATYDASLGNLDIEELGSVNPNAIALLQDLDGEVSVRQYTLTYPPLDVVFDPSTSKALIPTSARLHVLDLETLEEAAIPFTQEQGVQRTPDLVVPSSDGSRALVSVVGQPDLFVISLEPVLIENVIALPRAPWQLAFAPSDVSAIVVDGTTQVTFLDLNSFEPESVTFNRPLRELLVAEGPQGPFALLWSEGQPQLARVSLPLDGSPPEEADEYVLDAGIERVEVEPGGTAAVLFHANSAGLGSLSLSLYDFAERAPSQIFLDAPATDLLFLEAGLVSPNPSVLVALEQSARLIRYDLGTYEQVVMDTYSRPVRLGFLPGAGDQTAEIFVVHAMPTGLVSFVPPGATEEPPGGWPAAAGMATVGLLERE